MKKTLTIICLIFILALVGCSNGGTTNENTAETENDVQTETEAAVSSATQSEKNASESPDKVLVESITFNSVENIYVISGKAAKIIGQYASGAPELELGESATVELQPDEIVKCDNYNTTTIKKLYEDYYLSDDNQFLFYPMVYEVKDKSFGNYGN